MSEEYLSERESAILGQDFLTWLWFKSERHDGRFQTAEGEWFEVFLAERVSVSGGEGDTRETAVVTGAHSEMREARLGLKNGKRVNKAQLLFERDGDKWSVQVKAEDFALGTLKTPKTEKIKDADEAEGAFLEKMYLVEICASFLDTLYRQFLEARLSASRWEEELSAFRTWLREEA